MKTAELHHRSTETYPSEYKTGTSTIFKYFSQNKIYIFYKTNAFI